MLKGILHLHRPFTRRGLFFLRAFLFCCLGAALPVCAQSEEKPKERVVLQLKWYHQFQFAGYYMAKHLGYYEQAGLDVSIREGSPNLDVTEQVVSGQADFGVGTSSLLLDHAAGKPVTVLGVIYQHSPLALIMRTRKNSDTIESLKEGPIMMEAHSGDLLAMLHRTGLAVEKLNIVEHPSNALELLQKSEGIIASSSYLTDEIYALNKAGVPHITFTPRSYGVDFYGDNFFTTKEMVNSRRDLVEKFREATFKGWKEALENPEKAVDLILEQYSTVNTREKLLYEALITQDLMTKLVEPGYMNATRWEHIGDTYLETGMLKERPRLDGFIFEDQRLTLPKWFWPAAIGACALLLLLTSVSLTFRKFNQSLKQEVVLRRKTEQDLQVANHDLALAKELSEEANRQKTWFISNVSHDLRAPISAVISLSNIFEHHSKSLSLPEKFERFIKQLHSGSEFLMLMLNNILEYSVFETNAAANRAERIAFAKCSSDIISLVEPLAYEQKVKIEFQQHSDREEIIIDRMRISQIILNLVHNAIKFSPAGGTILVKLSLENEHYQIEVHDQGPGISPEDQERIFEIFSQIDNQPHRYSGTGLGLAIVQKNVEFLKGKIHIAQAHPTGSIFRVSIPLEPQSA